MATKASDTFTEASDTDLKDHTPDTGTGWDTDGDTQPEVEGSSDQLQHHNNSTPDCGREETDIGDDDMDVTMDCYLGDDQDNRRCGVTGRVASTEAGEDNAYWGYLQGDDAGGMNAVLDKVVSSSTTNLSSSSVMFDPLTDTVEVKLEIRTAAKKVYLDSMEELSSSDDSLTGNNFAGVIISRQDPRGDNFLSESVGAPPASNLITLALTGVGK